MINQSDGKRSCRRWGAAIVLALAGGAVQAADVGVSISISQPGVYGRIDIGQFPQPVLVRPQPVVIAPAPHAVATPVYLWVPPGHRKHWKKHCKAYDACGVPVYFVQEQWYQDHVMVRANSPGEQGKGKGKGHDK